MKRLILMSWFFILPSLLESQPALPLNVRETLARIEDAFRAGSPGYIDDLLTSGMPIRLGDSLYFHAFGPRPLSLLKDFFADKDSIDCHFGIGGNGTMTYSEGGARDTVKVDVLLTISTNKPVIYGLNISNYPLPMIFMPNSFRHK